MSQKRPGKPGKAPGKPPRGAGKASGKPVRGRRRRSLPEAAPRAPKAARERDPLVSLEDLPEERQAAAMSTERALDLAIAVRLAPPPEPALGLPDGNFALDELDTTLLPIDCDLGQFDPWEMLRYLREREAVPEAEGSPGPGSEGDPP